MAHPRAAGGPLHLEIYAEIKRGVLSGDIPPGTVLSEAELSRHWSVSRTPVREALRQLELDQLISWAPRRGANVARVTVRDLRDMVELRQALEGLAVRLAAERATDQDLLDLRAVSTPHTAWVTSRARSSSTMHSTAASHWRPATGSWRPGPTAS